MRYRDLLTESVKKYQPMFAAFADDTGRFPDWVYSTISGVEKSLKREDRIVWALRWIRLSRAGEKPNPKYLKDCGVSEVDRASELMGFNSFMSELPHFFSLPISKIEKYVFTRQLPSEVSQHWTTLEREWQAKVSQKINHAKDYPDADPEAGINPYDEDEQYFEWLEWENEFGEENPHHYGDVEHDEWEKNKKKRDRDAKGNIEKIIDFGDGWAWWNLNRGYCTREGTAMGHCGNAPSVELGDTVLSLRKDLGGGMFRPSLTFILRDGGMLGETKGRANEKPAPRYWPYIVRLLLNPIVKGCLGGGYAAGNNFSILDLPEDIRDMLVARKPALLSMHDRLAQYRENPTQEAKDHIVSSIDSAIHKNGHRYKEIVFPPFDHGGKDPIIATKVWNSRAEYVGSEGQWNCLENLDTLFDEIESVFGEMGVEHPEALARQAMSYFYDDVVDALVHYVDEFLLDGVGYFGAQGKFIRGVSISGYLNPTVVYLGDGDEDEVIDVLDEISEIDETVNSHYSSDRDWSDLSLDELSSAGYEIARYVWEDKSDIKSVAEAIIGEIGSGNGFGHYFSRDPNQAAFPFYDDE